MGARRKSTAWRRRDCGARALASAVCATTVPVDLGASRICSPRKRAQDPQYFRSWRMPARKFCKGLWSFGGDAVDGIGLSRACGCAGHCLPQEIPDSSLRPFLNLMVVEGVAAA
jgi:hypothetical protein